MLRMASSMKDYALGFQVQFKQDEEVMNRISTKQDDSNDKTVLETKKLQSENR